MDSSRPLLRVVHGDPTPEELAAVVTVLTRVQRGRQSADAPPASAWSDRARLLKATFPPGPDAWRTSSWPR